jgi:two-component system, chemotaxis family, sensor kinase Cph1
LVPEAVISRSVELPLAVGSSTTADATETPGTEETLRQLEDCFRLLVSGVQGYAIVVLDPQGRVANWNQGAEGIEGYNAQEIIGQHFSRFFTGEDVSHGKPDLELEEAAKKGRFECEGWRVRKDGSCFFANVVITALRDEAGRLRGFGQITRDITERRNSEDLLAKKVEELKRSNEELQGSNEEMKRSSKELQQFARIASRDLQEPLRMVTSYTQLLARQYKGSLDSDADEFIGFAVDGCSRLKGLLHDLIAYLCTAPHGNNVREISGESALNESLKSLRTAMEQSGAVVTHDTLPVIRTDEAQLTRVFQHLVGNAIKYRGAEVPRVHVAALKNLSNEWIFSVRDNGIGIAPEHFDRIFVLVPRLHGQHESEGSGIGLAICKKIVERLGGRIWVESQPQKGSTFYFALPEKPHEQISSIGTDGT